MISRSEKDTAILPDEWSLQIRIRVIPWIITVWLGLSIGLSVLLYSTAPRGTDGFSRRSQPLTLLFLTTGFGVAALTFYAQVRTAQASLRFQQSSREYAAKAYSLEILHRWDTNDFRNEREAYREMRRLKSQLSETDFVTKIDEESKHRNAILDIANLFEDVEVAIGCGLANEAVLKQGFAPLVGSINSTYAAWFSHLKTTDNSYYNQFTPFFNLLEKWA